MSQLFRDYDIDGCLGLVLIDIESNTSQIVLKLNPNLLPHAVMLS